MWANWKTNIVSATMFPGVGKLGNIAGSKIFHNNVS
jgi:hypothetical protein